MARVDVWYGRNHPVTLNHPVETGQGPAAAAKVALDGKVNVAIDPIMGSEDFSYMLLARPGALNFIGDGDTAGCTIRPMISTRGDPTRDLLLRQAC
ncbi:hypothetical protein X753_31085 [Mesorhizobium sp. LNJC399B00]|nr:hypothetical protein X753_31085 [Mesorhizobium sp. LNJC399B00]